MPITRQTKEQQFQHVLGNVFGWPVTNRIEVSLESANIKSVPDLVSMSPDDLDALRVQVTAETERPLDRWEKGRIRAFQSFLVCKEQQGEAIGPTQCTGINMDTFDAYRASANYILLTTTGSAPPPRTRPPLAGNNASTHTRDPLADFKRGIKQDVSLYLVLKDEKQ